jgi:hypothetical protein
MNCQTWAALLQHSRAARACVCGQSYIFIHYPHLPATAPPTDRTSRCSTECLVPTQYRIRKPFSVAPKTKETLIAPNMLAASRKN